jgi:hypothetical protein
MRHTTIGKAALAAAAAVMLTAAPASAAKPSSGGSTSGTSGPSCQATPSPASVGTDVVISGTGLGANQLLSVMVSDAVGTSAITVMTDTAGAMSVSKHVYWAGTNTVKISTIGGKRGSQVASCSFQVV